MTILNQAIRHESLNETGETNVEFNQLHLLLLDLDSIGDS